MRPTKLFLVFFLLIFGKLIAQNTDVNLEEIKTIVKQWSDAHNERDFDKLSTLYAPTLLFYSKDLSREMCINEKRKAFKASPGFHQDITSNIEIAFYQNDVIKCSFTKRVKTKKIKNYPSYLLLKAKYGGYLITGEGDQITDSNLNYNLNLGDQISFSENQDEFNFSSKGYIILGIIVFAFIVTFLLIKRKKATLKLIENDFSNNHLIEVASEHEVIEYQGKWASPEAGEKALKALNSSYNNTKTFITDLFNKADSLDRKLYGKRMKIFIIGCFIVLLGAPLCDYIFNSDDLITFFSTFVFLIFILILLFSFIGSWRDDNGNVTWNRTKSRIKTYYEILNDTVVNTRTSSKTEILYKLGQYLLLGGVGWAAFKNLSVFIRKIFWFSLEIKIEPLLAFEKVSNQYFLLPILTGFGILLYLYNSNANIFERIKIDIMQFIGISNIIETKYRNESVSITSNPTSDLVFNPKGEHQFVTLPSLSNSLLFNDFAFAIKSWNPRDSYYEYEYQDKLIRHLRKSLPEATIESEYPIGEKQLGNKGRADIVINDTILIEMKRDSSAGGIQRAKGQIAQYAEAWKNKGPVILLLCDYNFEHARNAYHTTMQDQMKLGRPVITIVAKTKK